MGRARKASGKSKISLAAATGTAGGVGAGLGGLLPTIFPGLSGGTKRPQAFLDRGLSGVCAVRGMTLVKPKNNALAVRRPIVIRREGFIRQ